MRWHMTWKRVMARLAGIGLGLALLTSWLVAWHWASDAAGFFAPALVIVGLICLTLAHLGRAQQHPLVACGLRTAGGGAVLLASAAALSLGAFLPPQVAEWVSPALGRFGGPPALLILASALLVAAQRGWTGRWRESALDAATLLVVAAAWVWEQTTRQESFPTPPTTAAIIGPRLRVLLVLGVALGAVGVVLTILRRTRPSPPSSAWAAIGAWCWRWGGVASLLGLTIGLATGEAGWWRFVAPVVVCAVIGVLGTRGRTFRATARTFGRGGGWLALVVLALGLVYAATSEDLEIVLLRNTAERRVLSAWRGALGTVPTASRAIGGFGGAVRDQEGRPIAGASVVVADTTGQTFSAVSDANGRYRVESVPAGNYLPLAVGPTHQQGGRAGLGGRVATVRAGRTTTHVDFRLRPRPAYDMTTNDTLRLEPQSVVTIEGLQSSTVLRRSFTFANRGKVLDGGLIHEPPAEAGAGPFPILLIIYPGEAASWEGVSAPLAARGYVVVSYFPRRLLDLDGDMDDLRLLLNFAATGQLSAHGDRQRVVLVGGSVSTAYTYLLARSLVTAPVRDQVRAAIQYGGLFDLFLFRQSWEEGQVIIDPGISELEYLLVAFGRPDTRPEIYLRFSPRYGLGPESLPPTLLVHAEKDIIVPPEQSRLAADGLASAAIQHQLLLYPDLEHYLDVSKQDPEQLDMLEQTITFLQVWTGPR